MPHFQSIYHITHLDNLASILANGCLWSDREIQKRGGANIVIGMDTIKKRRLVELSVSCHDGTFVGDYVPFYFCPRSVMLYLISKGSGDLKYEGGQETVIHLVSTIGDAVKSAGDRRWAFSDVNAGASYAQFSNDLKDFRKLVDMTAVNATHWSDPTIKPKKQAEFLVYENYPWTAFRSIGVKNSEIAARVKALLNDIDHRPSVRVEPSWYY